jgi:hypothetical protein
VEVLNDVAPYNSLLQQRYALDVDCYLFRYSDEPNSLVLLGPTGADSSNFCFGKRMNVDTKLVNKKVGVCLVLGILPKGTIIEIVDVRRTYTFEYDIYHFDVVVEGDLGSSYGKLDAMWLIKKRGGGKPPISFDNNFVTRIM